MNRCFAPQLCGEWKRQEIKDLLSQLVHDRENVDVLVRLGRHHFDGDNHPIAFDYLWQAYDISKERNEPNAKRERYADLDVTMALADLHLMRGEYDYAKRKFWEAMQIDWNHQAAHDGMKLARIGDPAEAKICNANTHCKGVLRTIFPDQHKPRFSSHQHADRVTGEATVEFIPS